VPSQSNPADLISRVIEPTTLSTSTLWWKEQQWLSQDPSNWPTTEFNTTTDNMEIRHVHLACLQTPQDFTQLFSKLKYSSVLLHTAEVLYITADISKQTDN
jgi:hypothetical protein